MSSDPTATLIDLKAAGLASAICSERFLQLGARTHGQWQGPLTLGRLGIKRVLKGTKITERGIARGWIV